MFLRSFTLALMVALSAPAFADDNDSPLAADRGQARPVIVIANSAADPALVKLLAALKEPANEAAFKERDMVLYTVVNTIGQRNGKDLDPQTTMALIRALKLGASADAKVILVGKDGEKKLEHSGAIDPKQLFSLVDEMPMREKEASKQAEAPAAAPAPAPAPLDD